MSNSARGGPSCRTIAFTCSCWRGGRFAEQGIGQGLIRACIDNGSRKDYRAALTEATGKVSQHAFRKNGFIDRFSVSYQKFLYENKAVFASIKEHEKAILMDRSLA